MKTFIAFLMLVFSVSALSETYDLASIQSSKVEWVAVGNPGFLKIESKNGTLTGTMSVEDGTITGSFHTSVKDFKTGIRLRDNHMHDKYLESKKYPEAIFILDPVKVSSTFKGKGTMNFHGVEKNITWDCQAGKADGLRKISCVSAIILTDFNVEVPSYLGVTVAKDVKVKVTLVI
jgi:hypothetical protein